MRVYRQASAADHTVFFMSLNVFTEWCSRCDIPDNNLCRQQDLDTIFIATNVVTEKGRFRKSLCAAHSLSRFQFMEALLRIAIAKFVKCKLDSMHSCPVGT